MSRFQSRSLVFTYYDEDSKSFLKCSEYHIVFVRPSDVLSDVEYILSNPHSKLKNQLNEHKITHWALSSGESNEPDWFAADVFSKPEGEEVVIALLESPTATNMKLPFCQEIKDLSKDQGGAGRFLGLFNETFIHDHIETRVGELIRPYVFMIGSGKLMLVDESANSDPRPVKKSDSISTQLYHPIPDLGSVTEMKDKSVCGFGDSQQVIIKGNKLMLTDSVAHLKTDEDVVSINLVDALVHPVPLISSMIRELLFQVKTKSSDKDGKSNEVEIRYWLGREKMVVVESNGLITGIALLEQIPQDIHEVYTSNGPNKLFKMDRHGNLVLKETYRFAKQVKRVCNCNDDETVGRIEFRKDEVVLFRGDKPFARIHPNSLILINQIIDSNEK